VAHPAATAALLSVEAWKRGCLKDEERITDRRIKLEIRTREIRTKFEGRTEALTERLATEKCSFSDFGFLSGFEFRFSNFSGAWCFSICMPSKLPFVSRQVSSVSRMKFCDTAKSALLPASNVKETIRGIRAIRGQTLSFLSSFELRFSNFSGAWCFSICKASELTFVNRRFSLVCRMKSCDPSG
jgi:hypothetical protein